MFGLDSKEGFTEIVEGIRIKAIARGERTIMTKFLLRAGAALSEHAHPNEQIGYLVSGRMRLYIGNKSREVGPGDSWCVGAEVRHKADVLEDSMALEVFAPSRPDYLKYLNARDIVE